MIALDQQSGHRAIRVSGKHSAAVTACDVPIQDQAFRRDPDGIEITADYCQPAAVVRRVARNAHVLQLHPGRRLNDIDSTARGILSGKYRPFDLQINENQCARTGFDHRSRSAATVEHGRRTQWIGAGAVGVASADGQRIRVGLRDRTVVEDHVVGQADFIVLCVGVRDR